MKKISRATEAEVIAEFLRSEFYRSEYDPDRHIFEPVVNQPDLTNQVENALRRALLYRRRGPMWRELPSDTEWWEVEMSTAEIEAVSVFPRAHWRGLSDGKFKALDVAARVKRQITQGDASELTAKMQAIGEWLRRDDKKTTILLIGKDEQSPVTLLEGNHRFVMALSLPREHMVRRLRFVAGLSPNMERCCWYRTTLPTLSHYLKNRIKYFRNREADVRPFLTTVQPDRATLMATKAASAPPAKTE